MESASSLPLFEAIAASDTEALVHLYGHAAVNALIQYLHDHAGSEPPATEWDRATDREEKMDDFFSAMNRSSLEHSPIRKYMSHQKQYSGKSTHQHHAELLREFTAFLNRPDRNDLSDTAEKAVPAAADRLVRDAVTALSDTRPPVHFILYPEGLVVHSHPHGAAGVDEHEQPDHQQLQQLRQQPNSIHEQQPIFDGAVANSTPAVGATQGGGVGTALHAAVALDQPLTLALLLVMGADGRACHTAFRRLIVHEAACNGSTQCLRLLLELGHRFGRELAVSANLEHPPVPQRSPESVRDFAFFPRRTIHSTHVMSPKHVWSAAKKYSTNSSIIETVKPGTDVLSLLRQFRSLAQQVELHQVTKLDAARILVNQATLSETTQQALAKMCGFGLPNAVSVSLMRSTYLVSPSSRALLVSNSDGHGNSPLHWAAFKNESAAVQLLLEYESDPNARAHPSGWTPLHDAAYSNGAAAIDLLIKSGATVDARAHSGATPLCFAAQEDSAEAAALLLECGADLRARCCAPATSTPQRDVAAAATTPAPAVTTVNPIATNRFSGYTPLHYCAHYNAHRAAVVLLRHPSAGEAMEITDLNDRLPIHVAVARGSSDVLRELLRAGARVETKPDSRVALSRSAPSSPRPYARSPPTTPPRMLRGRSNSNSTGSTPVSSPILRSLIPAQPVQSSKPWNCLSQRSIDECRTLIQTVEQNWAPDRHSLFTPADRRAVAELLRVGKRLELDGSLRFTYLWPEVLSFCGRGWFEVDPEQRSSGSYSHARAESYSTPKKDDASTGQVENENLSLPTLR